MRLNLFLCYVIEKGATMRDIMDELRKRTPGYLEIDGGRIGLTEIIADDDLRAKAIKMLNAKLKPYRNKDFPPEITTAWLTKLYLRAKGYPDEGQRVVEEIRCDLLLGWLRKANFYH
jgi:hypothetical protein